MKKLSQYIRNFLIVTLLLLSAGTLFAQGVVVTSVTPQPASVDFADTNFQMDLEVGLTLPVGVTTAEVKVTFATGLEYVSVTKGAGAISVVRKTGDTDNKAPTFTVTGTAGAPLLFTVKKKVTQAALASFTTAGVQFYDNVSATPAGPNSNRQSAAYKLNWPILQITLDIGAVTEPVGTYTHSFTVKNTSEFKLKEIYFSVDYEAGIEKVSLTAPSGYTLTEVGTVPTGKGLPSEGKDLYKLTKTGSFAANETITLTEKYEVKVCGSNSKQVKYTPYWGPSATELYWKDEINTPASRTVNLKAVNTTTVQVTGSQENYFEWKDGLCGAVVGTGYTAYKNNSEDNSTAYKNKIRIAAGGIYIPTNISIIAADNTKILLSPGNGTTDITLDLNNLAALSVTALAGKDVGLTDEDNDGFADDLKKDAVVRICYDLKTQTGATTFTCVNKVTNFNMSVAIFSSYEDACGQEKAGARYNPASFGREFSFTDGSAQPAQLVKDQAIEGYLMLSYGYLSSYQNAKGQSWRYSNIRYRYYAKLPQGVKMKNIRYYYGQDPNDRTVPSVPIADVPAGGVLDYIAMTNNYPAGTDNDMKGRRKPGYIAYELELEDCTGVGLSANLEYHLSVLDENEDGTFCEIPRVCEIKAISMGCPTTTCPIKGPQMLSTKVERTDDSYGWTDATMTHRVVRTDVTASQRRRALYLDHIEVISEGQQSNAGPTDNLYYYMAVAKTAELEPKSIKVKVGSYETTLQASAVVSRTQDAQGKYFLWNLTSALPAGVLAASQTFSVVATYQVMNANIPNGTTYAKDIQSGQTSFFYSLDDKTDTNMNAQGYHTAQQHCGVDLIPVFNIIETYTKLASNGFTPEACNEYALGGSMMYSTRTTLSTDNFTGEYRPGRRIKKITIKMPLSYRIIRDKVTYSYNAVPSDVSNNNRPSVPIPLNKWTMSEGSERVYTYTNPSNTADPYYLPPGMVTMKGVYAEFLQPVIQPSCSTKEATSIFAPSDDTDAKKQAALKAAGQKASIEVEFEDYYYHYAQTAQQAPVVNNGFENPMWYRNKPQLVINAEGQGLSFIANATEQEARFSLSVPPGKPNTFYAWVSIPDVPGMEVVSLQETNAAGVPQGAPFTPQTISGEKMFHVSQLITSTKKYYTVKFKITSCNTSALKFKLYAGWNCSGYPTGGYRTTCATSSGTEAYKEFTITPSNAQKQITAANTNPGQPGYAHQGLDNNKISMCQDTPYTYTIKSAGTGDIFKANLVVRKKPGLTIRKVQVEYDGVVYDTIVSNPKHIGIERNGDVTTYKLEDILPGGKLPGSLNEANPNKQQLKLTFSVLPTCNFNIGSSFDIDIVGENFCGGPATGQKTEEMVAGIIGANSDYTATNTLTYLFGNANICAGLGGTGARYHGRTQINITGSAKRTGLTGRLYIRVPKGFKYRIGSFTPTYTPPGYTETNPGLPPTTTSYPVLPPTELSYNTIGDETEVEIQIPQNLKNGHYFEYELEVYQDMNIPAQDCDQAAKLKYYTTDKITNLACPLLPSPSICHDVTIITGAEQKVAIYTERAKLTITQVKTTSEIVAGQEKVTFKYKVKNNSTTPPHNTILKVALYKDANNDGVLEDSELVDTFTDWAALPTGGEQEFTHDKFLPHADICRLYLVIRNKDNNCLCSDVKVAVPSPETITGLMDNADGCESNPYTFALKPGVPTYDSYTWEAVSPADALSYLSATNVATPTFTYTGAKLTATTEFKYKLKITRPNGGCESVQEVKLTVKPAPSITSLTAPTNPYCTGTTAATLTVGVNTHGVAGTLSYEWYESLTNAYNGTLKGSSPTFTPPTNAAGTKYYYVKVKNTGCGETLSNIVMVKTNATPAQPIVAQAQAAGCGTVSTAKVSNHSSYASGITFKVTKGGTLVSATVASNGSINGISEAGTYVIKAVEDGCESTGTTFTIHAKKPVPDKPTLTLTAESCNSATVAKITNHAAGKTYTFIKSSDNSTVTASVDGTGKITNLAVGKYKVKATEGGCNSELSDEFEIKAQKAVPTKPDITLTAETCASPTIAKITNYDPNQTYWLNGTQLTVTLTGEIQNLGVGSHTITAKNSSCESVASDSFTIKAKKVTPVKPTVAEDTAATCSAISTAKVSNYNANFTYTIVESANTNNTVSTASVVAGGKITGLPVGKYKVKATKDGCTSDLSDEFEIKDKKLTPSKPTVAEDTAATCTAISIAKLTNYDANFTYTFIKSSDGSTVSGVTMASDGKISNLAVGKYKVKATKDGCISDLSDEFEIKDIKPTPAVPTVSEHTAATCSAISIAKLNYTVGLTYIFVKSDDNTEVSGTSVDNTGKISDLSVGKYKVKAKKDGCESALSAEFEIKDKLPTPATPTIGEKTAATCTAISVAKVTDYDNGLTYTIKDSANATVGNVENDGTISGLTAAGAYKITATNTQGCTSAEATITIADVLPMPATPTPTATQSFCNSATIADLAPQGTDIKWYDAATGGSLLTSTTALVHNNKYYAARTLGSCESPRAEVTVKIISLAQPTLVATAVAPTCTVEGKAKITNYDPNATYTFTKADGTAVTGTITIAADGIVTGLVAGSYKLKASKDGCEATSADFQIADKLPTPAAPTIGEKTAATCTAISVAKVTDYDNGLTYTIKDSANATVGNVESDGTISGLTVAGSYKITATNTQGCTSAEATITINPVKAAPAKPEITLTPASCTSPTVAKIRNQASGLTYWHNGTQLTVNPITNEFMGLAPGTYTVTAKNNDNCESVASDSFEIKAQQTATTITTAPAGATYQKGAEATPLAVVATGEGTLSYKWYKNRDNNNTSGTEVGDNSPSYKPATDTVGSFYYWVEVTSDCGAVKSNVAEIKVIEGAPTIEANDDPDTTVRRGQEVAVLGNDKVNGNPATPADVDITISNDGGLTRVGVNQATGKIMIPNDAAPATYEIIYKICVKNQPTICDEAKVKITVEVPVHALKAVDDDFGKIPNAVDYTTVVTVFSSGVDTMEGVVGNLSPERDVVLTPGAVTRDGATITEGITMNPNGSITVKRGIPKGTYTYEYTICQKDVPTNCDTAKVTFEVIEAHIFAKDDGVWEVGTEGALTPSILNNDILGERVGIAPSEVDIQQTQGEAVIDKTLMVMNEDGRISVKKGIAEGTYTYYYTITEKANTANFSKAKVTIRVVSFSAQDDEFNITNDKTKEFKTESVLANDELNKKKNPSPVDDVILTKGEAKDSERNPTTALTMNDDGTITIAPNTPDGVYTYTYTICKKSPPTECKSAEAVIKLLPALIANDDDFTANPINPLVREGIAGNVLDNDRYADGKTSEHLDKVQITILDNDKSGARIEQNGNVVIPQGAPAGEYTLTYSLCMKDHPTICAEAKVKIVILEDKPIVIHNGISANGDGVNDGFMIEHIEGYPKNNLKIFNRWGVLVYEKDGYTNSEPFDGHSNGRATISAESKLPQGTYYYILEYQDTAEQTHTKKGWLYLKY
ncbi:T9SS type B sorting domain-containing protein [Capnocytophaga granulosa]